jgi:hypothetical protein
MHKINSSFRTQSTTRNNNFYSLLINLDIGNDKHAHDSFKYQII